MLRKVLGEPSRVMSIRRKVEPALSTVALWRAMIIAKRSGGETGEPSSIIEGARQRSDAAIMYDWPVIQPGVAMTNSTSRPG